MADASVNVTIVGAGAVGHALAYELSKTLDDIVVVDPHPNVHKMDELTVQTTHNSGVIHAGIYYDRADRPFKANLCPRGNAKLYAFCQEHDVPHRKTGKLVVATEAWQLEYLADVKRVADENGVPGVEWLHTEDEIRRFEPNVQGIAALHVPTSGIIDPVEYLKKLHNLSDSTGRVSFVYGSRVTDIHPVSSGFQVTTHTQGQGQETFETRFLINAAGLHADEVMKMLDAESPHSIRPTPGESAKFYRKRDGIEMTGMNVYPAPYVHDPNGEVLSIPLSEARERVKAGEAFYTLGVHLTPTLGDEKGGYTKDPEGAYLLDKTVTVGPAKNKYSDTKDPELLKGDYQSLQRQPSYYHQRVHSFFPGLEEKDVELHQVGVMATIKGYPDWVITSDRNHPACVHLVGIDSPGLTGSLAIAEHVKRQYFP